MRCNIYLPKEQKYSNASQNQPTHGRLYKWKHPINNKADRYLTSTIVTDIAYSEIFNTLQPTCSKRECHGQLGRS